MSETKYEEFLDSEDVQEEPEEGESGGFLTIEQIQSTDNIAELLEPDHLAKIGMDAMRHIEIDEESRSEWMEKTEDAFRLAMQVADQKSYPFDRASNVIYPLITTAALQFAQRVYPAIVPGDRVVNCTVIGDDTGQFQVETDQNGQPVFDEQGKPKAQMVVPPGIKASRADRVARHMSWQALYHIKDWEKSIDQAMHYLPIAGCFFRKVHYDKMRRRPCIDWIPADKFIINNATRCIADSPRYAIEFELYPHEIKAKQLRGEYLDIGIDGLKSSEDYDEGDEHAPRTMYEVYTRLDLDGDGYPEPYVMVMHEEGEVLRIEANFEEVNDDGTIEPYVDCVKYTFIPNPEGGFYDVGFGWLLGPINKTINTSINQLFDAGHWQNAPSGFLGRGIRLGRSGRIELTPNSLKTVDATGEDLQRNIWIYQHPGPSGVLFNLLGMMIEAGRDISSVQDILQGRSEKNLAPTTIATLVEQGMTTFTSIFKRVHRSLSEEFTLLYSLNAKTLPQHMYAYGDIIDDPQAIARDDYEDKSMDIRPVTDPKMVSDQVKQAKAQFLMQLAEGGLVDRRKVTERMLDAFNIDDIEDLLPDPALEQQQAAQQAKVFELQMAKAQADLEKVITETIRVRQEIEMEPVRLEKEINEAKAKFTKLKADAINSIADAEAAEAGTQIEAYRAKAERISNQTEE